MHYALTVELRMRKCAHSHVTVNINYLQLPNHSSLARQPLLPFFGALFFGID